MKYNIGDIIEVQGKEAYIDFTGKIEIIGEEDDFYIESKNTIKQVYIGKFLEDNHLTYHGKVIAFSEEFIDLELTRILLEEQHLLHLIRKHFRTYLLFNIVNICATRTPCETLKK